MSEALSYHADLIEQGYSEEEAVEHTLRYFPDFSLDGKKPDTINIMVEEHAGPQKETMNALVNAARTGTVDKIWPIVEATFAQGTLLETVDVGLKDIKNRDGGSLQSSLPDVLWDKVAAKILKGKKSPGAKRPFQ